MLGLLYYMKLNMGKASDQKPKQIEAPCFRWGTSMKNLFLLSFLIFYVPWVIAIDIEAANFNVTKSDAKEYGINVVVNAASSSCSNANDVSISYPKSFRDADFKAINISLKEDDKLLLDAPSVSVELDDYMGFKSFHGSVICIDSSLLSYVNVSLAYGRGEFITSEINLSGLDEF